jgi:hypothetical protein
MREDEPSMAERAGGNILFQRPPVNMASRRIPDSFFRVAGLPLVTAGNQSTPVPFKWPRGGVVTELFVSPIGVTTQDAYIESMNVLALKISIADARESITFNATPGSSGDDFILFSHLVGQRGDRNCYLERPVWDQLTWTVQVLNRSAVAGHDFTPEVSFGLESDPVGVRRSSYRKVVVAPGVHVEVLGSGRIIETDR